MKIAHISGHYDLTASEFERHYRPEIDEAIHMLDRPRHNAGFATVGGFDSDEQRNEAMTCQSDYDIAWVRHGFEHAGTARNPARRQRQIATADGVPPAPRRATR